jgi:uncharacterized surface protein with fasciclin (FAS1) repeats
MKAILSLALLQRVSAGQSIYAILSSREEYSKLVDLIDLVGGAFRDGLNCSTQRFCTKYTFLAPTNDALDNVYVSHLKRDAVVLKELLKYHMVSTRVWTSQMNKFSTFTTKQGDCLVVTNDLEINYANIVEPDLWALNGLVQGLNRLLLPPGGVSLVVETVPPTTSPTTREDPPTILSPTITSSLISLTPRAVPLPYESIFGILRSRLDFSDFTSLLWKANFEALLDSNDDQWTLLVPTNEAVASSIPREIVWDLQALTDLLEYHLLAGKQSLSDLKDGLLLMENGDQALVDVRRDGSLLWNGQARTTDDLDIIEATNGIIYILDHVLLPPPSLVETARSRGYTKFLQALAETNMVEAFEEEGPYTLFVAPDEAWANVTFSDPNSLRTILLNHITPGYVLLDDLVKGNVTTVLREEIAISIHWQEAESGSRSFTVDVGDASFTQLDILASNGIIHEINALLYVPG